MTHSVMEPDPHQHQVFLCKKSIWKRVRFFSIPRRVPQGFGCPKRVSSIRRISKPPPSSLNLSYSGIQYFNLASSNKGWWSACDTLRAVGSGRSYQPKSPEPGIVLLQRIRESPKTYEGDRSDQDGVSEEVLCRAIFLPYSRADRETSQTTDFSASKTFTGSEGSGHEPILVTQLVKPLCALAGMLFFGHWCCRVSSPTPYSFTAVAVNKHKFVFVEHWLDY